MQADKAAARIIKSKQKEALGHEEPFSIEKPSDTLRRRLIEAQIIPTSGPESAGVDALTPIKHWPEKDYPQATTDPLPLPITPTSGPLKLSLIDALMVAARNSREYQSEKENVFLAALDLELEADAFRNSYTGLLESLFTHDRTSDESATGVENSGTFGFKRRLKSGATLTGSIGIDLVNLLSSNGASSVGIIADASVKIPLLAGSGRHIVTEPLTQAERNVVYALWDFERFKRGFAVGIISDYLAVLQTSDQVENAENNYESQVRSVRQATARFNEDQLSKIELDQARQAELSARDNWISARRRLADTLDTFKQTLGLPTDSRIELDPDELQVLTEIYGTLSAGIDTEPLSEVPAVDAPIVLVEPSGKGAGPMELDEQRAVLIAFDHRLDLQTEKGRVYDAQRRVVVVADALKAGLNIEGSARAGASRSLGSVQSENARLRLDEGVYNLGVSLDLPWERTAQGLDYREAYISLERAVRSVQELEDRIKFSIRQGLRRLVQARERYTISRAAVALAAQRVDQTQLERELDRPGVQIRDVLEAQADLLRAQNDLSASLVDYRIAELELQRDMDVLKVNEKGLIDEYDPNQGG